jgi:hypothetical protein
MRAWLLVACVLAGPAFGESAAQFRFNIPVHPAGQDGLQRVALPLTVYLGARRADLGDLRLFNAAGERLPFAFTAALPPPTVTPQWASLPLFAVPGGDGKAATERLDLSIRQRADGTLVELSTSGKAVVPAERTRSWIADASLAGRDLRALRFAWTAGPAGVASRVRIEAGDKLSDWRQVAAGAPLVDLVQDGARLRQDRVELAPLKARYLRFTVLGDALAITAVEAELASARPEPPLQLLTLFEKARAGESELVFDAGAPLPVERVQVRLPEPNSVAPFTLYARADEKGEWRQVAGATAYRLVRAGEEIASPPIAIARRSERYWRVKFDPRGGGAGSGAVALELGWLPQQLVFAARGPAPYVLAFGRAATEASDYGIANLVPGYQAGAEFRIPQATLGPAVENAVSTPSPAMQWLEALDRKRAILWSLLGAAVLLLAAMAWALSRQMKPPAPPPPRDSGA